MNDYIKREDVLEICEWYQHEYAECEAALSNLTNEMRRLHPADVVERQKGRWMVEKGILHPLETDGICSVCGHATGFYKFYDYCPNCGAEMRNLTYTLSTESGTFSFRNTTQSNNSNALENNSNALEKDGAK